VDTRLACVCSVAQAPLLMLVKAIMLFDFWKVLDEDGVVSGCRTHKCPGRRKMHCMRRQKNTVGISLNYRAP
jgi:hypothetical protein